MGCKPKAMCTTSLHQERSSIRGSISGGRFKGVANTGCHRKYEAETATSCGGSFKKAVEVLPYKCKRGDYMELEYILPYRLKHIINNYSIVRDTVGMSPAKVFKLVRDKDILYLKISHKSFRGTTYEVKREKDIMLWLEGKISVPEVIHFEETEEYDFLLMSKVKGEILSDITNLLPERIIEMYVESIRKVQSIDISTCLFNSNINYRLTELEYLLKNNLAAEDDFYEGNTSFSKPEELVTYLKSNVPVEEFVFSHGDMCGSNIVVKNNQVSGFIDLGRAGKADRWYDIAFCVRNIREDMGNEKYVDTFFELLDIEPNWDKIDYYILLDELF